MDGWINEGINGLRPGEVGNTAKGANVSGRVLSELTNVDKWFENNISGGKRSTKCSSQLTHSAALSTSINNIIFAFISGLVTRGVHIRVDNHLHLLWVDVFCIGQARRSL